MTFCHNCGLKLTGNEKFCPNCGTDLQQQKAKVGINNESVGVQQTGGDVIGAGISGFGNVIGKEVSYSVQGNVYNIINSPQEVQEGFRKINTISTQLDIAPALPQLHHGTITTGLVEKTQEIAATRRVANQFLEEIGRIEKEKGTEIKEIKVGEIQISKNELLIKEHLLKGNEFYYKKEYSQAIEFYDKALEIDPKHAMAWNNKGVALYNLGKYKKAIEYYDKALEIDPKLAMAWNNKGLALYKLGKYNEAIEYYDKALEIDPKHVLAIKNRDIVIKEMKKQTDHPYKSQEPGGKKSRWKRIFR